MGRRKIEIKFINDDRNRSVTFIKRKNGLFKKAHELSILTGAKVTVHVEDIKERQFDYISANLGGENSLVAQFQSDDDEDDVQSLDGLDDTHETDLLESASSVGSVSGPGSKRDSGVIRGGHRRSQSSIHLSPNPNVPPSRRVSGHPYPRSPNSVPVTANNLTRPSSMDFGMAGYNTQAQPAGGPQRKFSNPTTAAHQYQQFQYPQGNQQSAQYMPPQTQMTPSNQFYFHPNQSHPAFTTPDSHASHAPSQQQMPRYNGSLFQANGHPATNSQQHLPAYPSNLAPSSHIQHNTTLPGGKVSNEYVDFGGGLEEYLDDEIEPDFDPLGTQASTPGNYDFSTNPSLTNLNTSLQGHANQQQGRNTGLGLGMVQPGGFPAYMNVAPQYVPSQHPNMQQQQQQQQRQFYNNPSGAQSTPNLAWTLGSQQTSPPRR